MNIFYPDIYAKNIYTINYNKLKDKGIKCLVFDLDNTLVPVKAKMTTREVETFIRRLRQNKFTVILMSNSPKKRVSLFNKSLDIPVFSFSMKPLKRKYKKMLKEYGFDLSEVAGIGDQIMTDIWGANKMGFTSILVDKMTKEDFKWTKLNRIVESLILKHFHHKKRFTKGEYYE